MFIDTHAHLNILVDKEIDELLQSHHLDLIKPYVDRANAAGVAKLINVGTSLNESRNCVAIARANKNVYATLGIHPCDVKADTWRNDIEEFKKLLQHKDENKIVGIGEIGLDYYHKPFDAELQRDAFIAQIELALEHTLPLSVHVRDIVDGAHQGSLSAAADDLLKVLEPYRKEVRAVIHCFQQQRDFADVVLSWGFFLGIDAPITYPKNQWFRDMLKDLPVDRLVLETDTPFLPPQEFRGKQNVPAYLPLFAQVLADIKKISVQELASITTANAERLFTRLLQL